jgi:hypothetical protein
MEGSGHTGDHETIVAAQIDLAKATALKTQQRRRRRVLSTVRLAFTSPEYQTEVVGWHLDSLRQNEPGASGNV